MSELEDELQQAHSLLKDYEKRYQAMTDKREDLENRSCHNNLRVIGVPETYKPHKLMSLCQTDIPKALGLSNMCVAERAHQVGPASTEGNTETGTRETSKLRGQI